MICSKCGGNKGACDCTRPLQVGDYVRITDDDDRYDEYTTQLLEYVETHTNRFKVESIGYDELVIKVKVPIEFHENGRLWVHAHNFEKVMKQ